MDRMAARWTAYVIACFLIMMVGIVAQASEDRYSPKDHEHEDQGEVNTTNVDVPIDVDIPIDASTTTTNTNEVSIVEEHPDDITFRNTPSLGGGAARGNAGFRIAVPGFGFGFDLPWERGDRPLLAIYDRLMLVGDERNAAKVMCRTSVMKKMFGKADEELLECANSLSQAASFPTPPPRDEPASFDTVGDEMPMLLADADVEEVEKELNEEKVKVAAQQVQIQDLNRQIQRQQQQQQQVVETVDDAIGKRQVQRASARAYLERIQQRKEEGEK